MRERNITQFMLELYHLNAVTDKERKLIEDALTTDKEVYTRYEELKRIDNEIKSRYTKNDTPIFTVNNNNKTYLYKEKNIKRTLIGLGIAAAILCFCIPLFLYLTNNHKANDTEIIANDTEFNDIIEEEQFIKNDEIDRIVIIPENTKKTELKIEENKSFIEIEPVVTAELPNNETGVYIRGGPNTPEQKTSEITEQKEITIPAGINFIFDSMFANRGLTNITIPERVTFISNNAFENNQIRNIVIPENVTSIGSGAFSNNPLISITIGADVFMEEDAFPANFAYFYNINDKISGTYTRTNISSNEWSKQ